MRARVRECDKRLVCVLSLLKPVVGHYRKHSAEEAPRIDSLSDTPVLKITLACTEDGFKYVFIEQGINGCIDVVLEVGSLVIAYASINDIDAKVKDITGGGVEIRVELGKAVVAELVI